jgi:hypothetical protein
VKLLFFILISLLITGVGLTIRNMINKKKPPLE